MSTPSFNTFVPAFLAPVPVPVPQESSLSDDFWNMAAAMPKLYRFVYTITLTIVSALVPEAFILTTVEPIFSFCAMYNAMKLRYNHDQHSEYLRILKSKAHFKNLYLLDQSITSDQEASLYVDYSEWEQSQLPLTLSPTSHVDDTNLFEPFVASDYLADQLLLEDRLVSDPPLPPLEPPSPIRPDYEFEEIIPNSLSEPYRVDDVDPTVPRPPRESSKTDYVEPPPASRPNRSRSQEKRNSKFSYSYLCHVLEQRRTQKSRTLLREKCRQAKELKSEIEISVSPFNTMSHDARRLQAFRDHMRSPRPSKCPTEEQIIPNGLFTDITMRCCGIKKDATFNFLVDQCHVNDMVAMMLAPIINSIKNMLTSKVTIGIALTIFAYYLAKFVNVPVALFTPVISLLLGYLIYKVSPSVTKAFTKLYAAMCDKYHKCIEYIDRLNTVDIDEKTFEYLSTEDLERCLVLFYDDPAWQKSIPLQTRPTYYPQPEYRHSFKMTIPRALYDFLKSYDPHDAKNCHHSYVNVKPLFVPSPSPANYPLKLDSDDEYFEVEDNDHEGLIVPNGLAEIVIDISEYFKNLLVALEVIPSTITFAKTLSFYSSSKKFMSQIYSMFQDIYPSIYEYITGKKYIDPKIAKYLAVFGDVAARTHEALKKSRSSNIAREDASFRLRITNLYEELLDSQMKLLEMAAPPQYMMPVNNLLREMHVLASECYARSRGEAARKEPVLILLRGPPGVGKTTLEHALAVVICQRLGIPFDPHTDFFSREAVSEFWDGYANQFFVSFDDAFQILDPELIAKTIFEIIKCKNTGSYKLNMAELQAKLNTFFNSKILFISTNIKNVVCDQIADIGAFYRRIDFDVVVTQKPPPNQQGSPTFDYGIIVNGVESDVVTLADSIIEIYKKRNAEAADVTAALSKHFAHCPQTNPANIIAPRNSTYDLHGKPSPNHHGYDAFNISRPIRLAPKPPVAAAALAQPANQAPVAHQQIHANGLTEQFEHVQTEVSKLLSAKGNSVGLYRHVMTAYYGMWNSVEYSKVFKESFMSAIEINKLIVMSNDFVKWVALFAVGYFGFKALAKLLKVVSDSIFPNSRKEKDKLTGDKKAVVTTKSSIRSNLEKARAKIDSKLTPPGVPKANSSSERWSSAMISYIQTMGWQNTSWVRDSMANIQFTDDFDVTQQERDDINRITTNTADLETYYEHNGSVFRMFGKALILNQNHLITPSHQVPINKKIVDMKLIIKGKSIDIKSNKVERLEDSDTCIITLNTILPCRDIGYMFAPLSEISSLETPVYLMRNFDEYMTIVPVQDFTVTDRIIEYKTDYDALIRCGSIFTSKVAVCPGDSGCFYVTRDCGRFRIVGMHISSSFSCAYGKFITREMLKPYLPPPRKATVPYDYLKQVIEQNSKTFDQEMAAQANCISIGVVKPRTMIASHSKINRSMLYRHPSLPPPTEFPANLKRTFNEDDPLLKASTKFRLRPEPDISEATREEIVSALLDIFPNVEEKKFYSNLQAVEGTAQMPHINMTTSSGFPECAEGRTPKTKLTPEDWANNCKQADAVIEDAHEGIAPQPIFVTSGKDETRIPPKVNVPRYVNAAPTWCTMAHRRVLGALMNMIHKYHNSTPVKVGTNVHGPDWGILMDRMAKISTTNIVELDYSGFEYNHFQSAFQIVAEFVRRLYVRSGFSEADAKVAYIFVISCCGGYVVQNENLIYVWMLLSGLPITAELNSLLNIVYQMLCFKGLTGRPISTMRELVESAYYGDDLLHAVDDLIADQFNALAIQKYCEEFLSMKVTPAADKSGAMPRFVSILECSFLKRKFAPREGRVDAPLNLDAMYTSLQYYVPVSHMTQRELLASKFRSFITELTHYPEEIYVHWTSILSQLKADLKIDTIIFDYPAALSRRIMDPPSE